MKPTNKLSKELEEQRGRGKIVRTYSDYGYSLQHPNDPNKDIIRGVFMLTSRPEIKACTCIVAVIDRRLGQWSAYMGCAPGNFSEDEALAYVARWGNKLSAYEAGCYFPNIENDQLEYR